MYVARNIVLFFSLIMICSVQEAAGRMRNRMQKNNFTLISSAFKHGDMIPKQSPVMGRIYRLIYLGPMPLKKLKVLP